MISVTSWWVLCWLCREWASSYLLLTAMLLKHKTTISRASLRLRPGLATTCRLKKNSLRPVSVLMKTLTQMARFLPVSHKHKTLSLTRTTRLHRQRTNTSWATMEVRKLDLTKRTFTTTVSSEISLSSTKISRPAKIRGPKSSSIKCKSIQWSRSSTRKCIRIPTTRSRHSKGLIPCDMVSSSTSKTSWPGRTLGQTRT